MTSVQKTTCTISEALHLVGRRLFPGDWTGKNIDATEDDDSAGYGRYREAKFFLRDLFYHGHVGTWTVAPDRSRKYIPQDAWGSQEIGVMVGCLLEPRWRALSGLALDEATSEVDGLLGRPPRIGALEALKNAAGVSEVPTPDLNRRKAVVVYVDQATLEKHLRKNEERQPTVSPAAVVASEERSSAIDGHGQAIEDIKPECAPDVWPGPVAGIAGVRVRKFTFTNGVKDALPVDDVAAIGFSDESFHIHVKWELDLAVVKQFIVRYEVFDAAGRLVTNRSNFHAPESPRWNTWARINFTKVNQPGKWKISIYVSTGPGEAKVGETYLTVKPEITQLPPEPIPLTSNMRMFCFVGENGRRFSIYVENENSGDRTCRASCSYTDHGQNGVLACSGTIPARAKRMVFCTKYGRNSKFVFTGEKTLACD